MKDKIKELEKIIKYSFKNNLLLTQSLTHKSFNHINNNEKLEFCCINQLLSDLDGIKL